MGPRVRMLSFDPHTTRRDELDNAFASELEEAVDQFVMIGAVPALSRVQK
jgi:hypothetical protein